MSFRRIPFQFSSTDPVERQAELEKRFGLSSRNKMYVDVAEPLSMGSGKNSYSNSSSPRLQHRVPIFVEGYDKPVKSSVDSTSSNCDVNKKPNVRVIPIEIEGAELRSTRPRTFSGPAGFDKEQLVHEKDNASPLKRSMQDLSMPTKMKAAAEPVVHNIPIKIEGRNNLFKSPKAEKGAKSNSLKKDGPKRNGCAASKSPNKVKSEIEPKSEISTIEHKAESDISAALKKIENVLEELRIYESGVQEFNGTMKDKQYRYLDEMLTRCMLRLDDVDTMGNDEVRSTRKNAVKKVQASVDLLETKITKEPEVVERSTDSEQKNAKMQSNDLLPKDVTMKELDTEDDGEVKNDGQISEVEMAENNDVQIDNRPVDAAEVSSSESSEVQMTEVESASQDNSEITDPNEQKIIGKSKPSAVSEVSEIEMVEANNASIIQSNCSVNEIQEVEMTENKPDEPSSVDVSVSEATSDSLSKTVLDTCDKSTDASLKENSTKL